MAAHGWIIDCLLDLLDDRDLPPPLLLQPACHPCLIVETKALLIEITLRFICQRGCFQLVPAAVICRESLTRVCVLPTVQFTPFRRSSRRLFRAILRFPTNALF